MFDFLSTGSSSTRRQKSGGSGKTKQERTLRVKYSSDPEIQAWRVSGPTAGHGEFDTKAAAMDKARSLLNDDSYSPHVVYTGIRVFKKNGALQKTIGDA